MILYQGLLQSPASWARVGRGYLKALLGEGIEVGAVAARGFRHDPSFPLPQGLQLYGAGEAKALSSSAVGVGFLHPTLLRRLVGEPKLNCFVWEASRVPDEWVKALRRGADHVLVPSEFVREALVDSGFPSPQLRVVPYGYDREVLDSVGARRDTVRTASGRAAPFTFLSVLAPHYRKGVIELLTAYRRAFTAADDVILKIKSTYDPGRARRRSPFEIPSWEHALREAGMSDPGAPPLELDLRTLHDEDMLAIYEHADVVVQPSWGEGFGLAMLEALAVGRPVLATAWGGHMDFLPRGADRLPYRLDTAGSALYEPVEGAMVARPEVDALAARMRWHYDHPGDSRRIGDVNRLHAAPRTWDAAARQLLEVIGEVSR